MDWSLQRWKDETRSRLQDVGAGMRHVGIATMYGYTAIAALMPVALAVASGQGEVAALVAVAGSLGGNLLAARLQHSWERMTHPDQHPALAEALLKDVATRADLRAELDNLFQKLDVDAALVQDLDEAQQKMVRTTLLEEKKALANGNYQAVLHGDHNWVVQGNDNKIYIDGIHVRYLHIIQDPQAPAREKARILYLKDLYHRCNFVPLTVLGGDDGRMRLEEVYVMMHTTVVKGNPDSAQPLLALEAARVNPDFVLLGQPGGGKSSLVQQLAGRLALAYLEERSLDGWEQGLLPIYMEIRRLMPILELPLPDGLDAIYYHLAVRLLEQWRAELQLIRAEAFEDELVTALHTGQVLLILDGLDEIPETLRERVTLLIQAAKRHYQGIRRVIVTCRERSYSPSYALTGFHHKTLAPFTPDQITAYIKLWYKHQQVLARLSTEEAIRQATNLSKRILDDSEQLGELASNPMLLATILLIQREDVELPQQRVKILKRAVELLLWRWQKYKGFVQISADLAQIIQRDQNSQMLALMQQIAYKAHWQVSIKKEEVDLSRGDMLVFLEQPRFPFLGDPSLANNFLDYVDHRAGILVGQGAAALDDKPAHYSFPHRVFREYLAGSFLISQAEYERLTKYRECAGQGDIWQLAVQLGAEEAFETPTTRNVGFAIMYSLCRWAGLPEELPSRRLVLWSAVMADLVGRREIQANLEAYPSDYWERGYLSRLEPHLQQLQRETSFTPQERILAGRLLAHLEKPASVEALLDEMPVCWVAAGDFQMGLGVGIQLYPRSIAYPYWMSHYPITQGQYQLFVADPKAHEAAYWTEASAAGFWQEGRFWLGQQGSRWEGAAAYGEPFGLRNYPVVGVSWYEALAFTRWLTDRWHAQGRLNATWEVTLPSELEWVKAARGGAGDLPICHRLARDGFGPPSELEVCLTRLDTPSRLYPWGDTLDPSRANYKQTAVQSTSPVGCFPAGASPYGCEEMSGNVWEWTRSSLAESQRYPADEAGRARREDLTTKKTVARVLVGGGYWDEPYNLRCGSSTAYTPITRERYAGFRVVIRPKGNHSAGGGN